MSGVSIAGAALLALAVTSPALAQEQQAAGGAETRYAAGVVWQGGVFGDDDPESLSRSGVILGLQVRHRTQGRVGASFEIAFQPVGLPNPHFDETLHTFYVLAGPEIGRRTYVRPVGGVALQAWSGSMTESGLNFALAAGIAVGRRMGTSRMWLNPEFVIRCSASPGAGSTMIGLQIAMGPRR
ncbi:MAG TPA: hypothetical protein VES67_19495 [Vicinamibacterales bacterium]|nr:hypothetical protein [Vicinamibacterales bacterium]